MSSSESLLNDAKAHDEVANKALMEATSRLTDLTTRGQEVDEPYLSTLKEMLVEDDLIGDLDRFDDMLKNFENALDKQRWHVIRRSKSTGLKSDLFGRFVEIYNLRFHRFERMLEIRSLIKRAKNFRSAAIMLREAANNLKQAGH